MTDNRKRITANEQLITNLIQHYERTKSKSVYGREDWL